MRIMDSSKKEVKKGEGMKNKNMKGFGMAKSKMERAIQQIK